MSPATPLRYEWNMTPWRKLERVVYKLQKRIYQASERGDVRQVHRLQRLLLASKAAKYLAVRRVTQDNRGKKTAGVDGKTASLNFSQFVARQYWRNAMRVCIVCEPISGSYGESQRGRCLS
jgi:retron-type reverse transcriptase